MERNGKEVKKVTKKEKYYYKRSIGLCTYGSCESPAGDGKQMCEYHRRKMALKRAERKAYLLESGKASSLESEASRTHKKIAKINSAARESGMSYGEYMASIREVKA